MARRPSILKHSTAVITNTAACQYILHPANIYDPNNRILYSPHSEYKYPTPKDIIFSTQRIHISHTPRYYILHTANTYIPHTKILYSPHSEYIYPTHQDIIFSTQRIHISLATRLLGLPSTLLSKALRPTRGIPSDAAFRPTVHSSQQGPSAYARHP